MLFTEHHESHAASAFYPSPFEEAAILTMDGVGEWATSSYGVGRGKDLELLAEIHYPHSLGMLYSAFTYYTGFKVNSGEYKVMGLAPYGEPRFVDRILNARARAEGRRLVQARHAVLQLSAGADHDERRRSTSCSAGRRARPEATLTQREMDLAASIQVVTEEVMLRMARHVHRETGMENLCLAGGVALNCVGNGRLLREGPFERIWIQPAAGDAGGALGVALAIHHKVLGNDAARRTRKATAMHGSYLGPAYSRRRDRERSCASVGAVYERCSTDDDAVRHAPRDCSPTRRSSAGIQGRMEFGPARARRPQHPRRSALDRRCSRS